MEFETDYKKILERVDAINPTKYGNTRNFIDGQVTYLSPYISRGVISTKVVLEKIAAKYPKAVSGKFVFELLWRDYFQRVLQQHPDIATTAIRLPKNYERKNGLPTAIAEAKTEIEAIDAAINELYETGYMHNHVRMYVAGICCNLAKYDFKQPADWLYYYLLDADIGSNYCSWQWVAGLMNSRNYFANQANVNRYCRSKQTGTFLDHDYKTLSQLPPPEVMIKHSEFDLKTKLPKTDLPKFNSDPILIYTNYNLDPLWRIEKGYNRVLLLDKEHFKRYPISEKSLNFIIDLSNNIADIQIFTGSYSELKKAFPKNEFIAKEHPSFDFEEATIDSRDWIAPEVDKSYSSFSRFYTKCKPYLKDYIPDSQLQIDLPL